MDGVRDGISYTMDGVWDGISIVVGGTRAALWTSMDIDVKGDRGGVVQLRAEGTTRT